MNSEGKWAKTTQISNYVTISALVGRNLYIVFYVSSSTQKNHMYINLFYAYIAFSDVSIEMEALITHFVTLFATHIITHK